MYGLAARRHPSHPAAEARINRRHDMQARDTEQRAEQVIDEADGMRGKLSKDAPRSQPNILQRTDRFVRDHRSSVRNPHHRLQPEMTADFFRATLMNSPMTARR